MYAFDYHRPSGLGEAGSLLAGKEDAKLLAGGQTLIPTMKQRLANPRNIVDLGRIGELKGIAQAGSALVIGAMTTHAEVASSPVVIAALPGLAALAGGIGDPHVRHKGTIGGSLANNDPAADYPAAVLALGASITTTRREIAADDFFQGMFTTALEEGEIITKVSFPTGGKFAYEKFANPASRYALVGVAVSRAGGGVRVAVTGAGSAGAFRVPAMEAALSKDFSAQAIAGIAVDASGLNSDIHAAADYRAHLIGVMAKRALAKA